MEKQATRPKQTKLSKEQLELQRNMSRYVQITKSEGELKLEKEKLREWFMKQLTQQRTDKLRSGRLVASRNIRIDRSYRVTPEFVKIVTAAKVETFVSAKPIDEAIKEGKLPSDQVIPFAVAVSVPYFTVTRDKKDGSRKEGAS